MTLQNIGREPWSSGSEGRGFESRHRILDGHFLTYICCEIVLFVWKDENKRKRGRDDPP